MTIELEHRRGFFESLTYELESTDGYKDFRYRNSGLIVCTPLVLDMIGVMYTRKVVTDKKQCVEAQIDQLNKLFYDYYMDETHTYLPYKNHKTIC